MPSGGAADADAADGIAPDGPDLAAPAAATAMLVPAPMVPAQPVPTLPVAAADTVPLPLVPVPSGVGQQPVAPGGQMVPGQPAAAAAAAHQQPVAAVGGVAAAANPDPRDTTCNLEKHVEFRWAVARYSHEGFTLAKEECKADRAVLEGIMGKANASSKYGPTVKNDKKGKGKRLRACRLCVKDIINNHPYVVENSLTRDDINVDSDVDPTATITGWDQAAPSATNDAASSASSAPVPGATSGGDQEEAEAAAAGSVSAEVAAGANNAGVSSADANTNDADADASSGAGPAAATASGGGEGVALGTTDADADAHANTNANAGTKRNLAMARGGAPGGRASISGGEAMTETSAAATPDPKKRRAAGSRQDAEEEEEDKENCSTARTNEHGDGETDGLGSAGSNFILQLSLEDQERINILLDAIATDEGQATVQQKGRLLNGGAMSMPVSADHGNPDKNKAYRELKSHIPAEQFEDFILNGILEARPDLSKQARNGKFKWAVGSMDLLIGQGDKRAPQPTHADCERSPHQYFGSVILNRKGAEGTEFFDQSQTVVCSTASNLQQHAAGWKGMSDGLAESLDKNPAAMKLLQNFGQVVSGGQRVLPGMVKQFFTTLLGGSHPHNGPPSETKNRVVLFFTLYRIYQDCCVLPYDGNTQHSREMLCMKLYEALRDDLENTLSTVDAKFLLEKFLHYVEDGATRGAQDNSLVMSKKWTNRITKFREGVKKQAEAVCEVNRLKAELSKTKAKASNGFDEYAALGKKSLVCASAEKDELRAELTKTHEANKLILRDVGVKEDKLKVAKRVQNKAELDVEVIRSQFVTVMLTDEHESGLD